jgi:hypothetical protein
MKKIYRHDRNPGLRLESYYLEQHPSLPPEHDPAKPSRIYYGHFPEDYFTAETFTIVVQVIQEEGLVTLVSLDGDTERWQYVYDLNMPYFRIPCV